MQFLYAKSPRSSNYLLTGYQAETFSAQETINARLVYDNALTELEDLMNQVFIRRAEHISPIPYVPLHNLSPAVLRSQPEHQRFVRLPE